MSPQSSVQSQRYFSPSNSKKPDFTLTTRYDQKQADRPWSSPIKSPIRSIYNKKSALGQQQLNSQSLTKNFVTPTKNSFEASVKNHTPDLKQNIKPNNPNDKTDVKIKKQG